MRRDLSGRRVLITGASSGIGRGLAHQLARVGARLILAARTEDKLRQLAGELAGNGTEVLTVPADVTVSSDRDRLFAEARSRFGGLDILINNAGIASWAHFRESTEAVLRQIMEVNFFAPAELIRLAVPILADGRQPAIVNVASMCGRRAMPAWSEYSASKFALCGLTEALRAELALVDIDILLIVPGLTRSDLPRHLLQAKGRAKIDFTRGMLPEAVAGRIVDSLRRNRTETTLGREARMVLLVNKFFPRLTDWLLARKLKKMYESP
jgi:short-subunit dehydrogenase